ncbi:MAG: InlB B-repeat-containing protein, partial [Candidatus Gracilibacteria bacterium]|nr:InlB B-repeat-containing protein [Candidatus Gracilibacteria bacterium]
MKDNKQTPYTLKNPSSTLKSIFGFTLTELIITIAILAILSTIAFLSLINFQSSARDGVRVSDISMLTKSMEMSRIGLGSFPLPDNAKEITFKSGTVWTQGNISDGVIRLLKNFSKKPLDPKYEVEYSYSLTTNKQEYQIGAISEKNIVYNYRSPLIEKVYASDISSDGLQAYTKGNYDQLFVSSKVGGECYLVATPSLMLSSLPTSLKLEDAGSSDLVFKGEGNLPLSYENLSTNKSLTGSFVFKDFNDPSVLIYTGCFLPETLTGVLVFASDTKKAYEGVTLSNGGLSDEISTTINADSLVRLGVGIVNNNLKTKGLTGDKIIIDYSTAIMPNFTCTAQPIMSHANSFTIGNPTDFNQEWVYSDTEGNCTFACDSGYAFDSSSKTCVEDVCQGSLSNLNGELISGSTQSVTKTWTYSASSTPGVCSYQCSTGHSFDSGQNKCLPDNCIAQTVTINSHSYDIPALNHDVITSKTSSQVTIDGGKVTFDDDFKCTLGIILETGLEAQNPPVCDTNYSVEGLTCKADSKPFNCSAKPANTLWNTVSSYTQTWNGNAWLPTNTSTVYNITESSNTCNYICDNGFHSENSGDSCISDIKSCTVSNGTGKQTRNTFTKVWGSCNVVTCNSGYVEQSNSCVADVCGGIVPTNGTSNATSQTVTKSWVYNLTPGQCSFKCDTNYTWNGSNACIADSRTFTCPTTRPANADWNTVPSYSQTWNGVAWLPANSTTEYNTTASSTSCRYNCSPGFHSEDGGTSCISNIKSCTVVNGLGSQTWNSSNSSWNTCTVSSCNTGYTTSSNTCIASNCTAGNQTVNGHTYAITAFNHSTTQSKSVTIGITNGTRTYTQVFSCDYGNVSPSGSESDSPNCTLNYTWDGGSCVAGTKTYTCNATIPANSIINTVSSYLQTWNGSAWLPADSSTLYNTTASTTSCNYKCKPLFHTENLGTSCISDTKTCTITNGAGSQTWNGSTWETCTVSSCNSGYVNQSNICVADVCGGTVPANGTSNATSQTITKSWVYNLTASQCTFKCNTNYTWNGTNACVANTQTYSCPVRPSYTDWNTVGSYTQTWNGSSWLPANSTTTYNTTASTTACNYKCSTGYHYESGCISNTKACTIANGAGSQTWSATRGTCTVTSCNSGYVQSSNTCVPASCTTPWGATVANGASVTAYSATSATSPTTCASIAQQRTCTNGVLSNTYNNNICTDITNGVCNTTTTSIPTTVAPATNLCTTGTPTSVTSNVGTFSRTCNGINGANPVCNNTRQYTVTFNANGGTAASPATKVVAYNTAVGALSTTSRTGYTFNGWFTATTGGTAITTTTVITGAVTYYAQWTAINYTVTFNSNLGVAASPATKSVAYNTAVGTLSTTSRTGYTFNGWFTATTGGTAITTTTVITGAVTYYAQWTAINYTVTFDANGGTISSPATKSVAYNTAVGSLSTTSRTGYTFAGWFTATTGGTAITTATVITGAVTYYAQWTAINYTVTFNSNLGTTASPATKVVAYNTAVGALSTTSRTGYTFAGWFTATTGGTAITTATVITGAVTYYAQWTA